MPKSSFYSCPPSAAFRALLDNYETEAGHQEVVTDEEYQENWTFINLIMEAPVMQECHRYLASKGKADEDVDGFKKELYNMWFKLYKRKRQDRSVGCRHESSPDFSWFPDFLGPKKSWNQYKLCRVFTF